MANQQKRPIPLQNSLITRALTQDDVTDFTDLINLISLHMKTNRTFEPEFILSQWQEPGFDIENASRAMFTENGKLVAYAVVWDTHDTPVHPFLEFGIHPDYHDAELGGALLDWAEEIAKRVIPKCPPDARISIMCYTKFGYAPYETLMSQQGFSPIRYSYRMLIEMVAKPEVSTLPDGIVIRAYNHPQELPMISEAFQDSFEDHFGFVRKSKEQNIEEWEHWLGTDKYFDPDLFFVAMDTVNDTIAGLILCFPQEPGDATVAEVDIVGVLRPYRRRGIARAMLLHAFDAFWERGHKRVALGVDASSLTNAVALYEGVGMHINRQYVRYEKLIREGEELGTMAVD